MVYRLVLPLAVTVLLTGTLPASAATILEKSIDVEIRPDGGTFERSTLQVRMDAAADLAAWSPYPIYFDENRTIEGLEAYATTPDGKTLRGELGTAGLAGEGKFRSSSKVHTVRFPALPAGSVLTVETTAKQRSDFHADGISLVTEKAPIERLRVAVRGGGRGWRWHLGGSRKGLAVQESAGGVVITGASLPALKKERFARRNPPLRLGRGGDLGTGRRMVREAHRLRADGFRGGAPHGTPVDRRERRPPRTPRLPRQLRPGSGALRGGRYGNRRPSTIGPC